MINTELTKNLIFGYICRYPENMAEFRPGNDALSFCVYPSGMHGKRAFI